MANYVYFIEGKKAHFRRIKWAPMQFYIQDFQWLTAHKLFCLPRSRGFHNHLANQIFSIYHINLSILQFDTNGLCVS